MALFIIILGFALWLIVRAYENRAARDFFSHAWRVWKSWDVPTRAVMIGLVACATMVGGSKGPSPLAGLYRVLLWHGNDIWPLLPSAQDRAAALDAVSFSETAIDAATNTAREVADFVATNHAVTLSFDWHAPDRLPWHDRQNVLGRTVRVTPTNINGVCYEDHYVAFNASATTNPAVILIEYAALDADGRLVRAAAETVTNSYPVTVPVALQSGVHTCYWFRCAVPPQFTNACVRDWNGEALFGSPAGSGKGFDLLGTLVIDDGDQVWVGATTNMVCGSRTNSVRNGIILEGQP